MRSLLLAALLLCLPAHAQDSRPTKEQDSRSVKEKEKDEPPALLVIADALVAAQKSKVLQARLLDEHAYFTESEGQSVLCRLRGEASQAGITLEFDLFLLSRGYSGKQIYRFDPQGSLQKLTMVHRGQGRGSEREDVFTGMVEGDEVAVTWTRNGEARGKEERASWRLDVLPFSLTMFALPALADQGLPRALSGATLNEAALGKRKRFYGAPSKFAAAAQEREGEQAFAVYAIQSEGLDARARVFASGERRGQIAQVAVSAKRGKTVQKAVYRLLDKKECAQILAHKDAYRNEAQTVSALARLASLQEAAKAAGAYQPDASGLKDKSFPGYEIFVRVSPDGSAWMAVAIPQELGKSGRFHYAVNAKGSVYRSRKEIALADDGKLPPGLEKVR